MKNTTLGYIEKDGKYLMLHRIKKINDMNHDKWIGIGGKVEPGESPHECMVREAYEETGLTLNNPRYRGLITFISNEYEQEIMHLYTATDFSGTLNENCNEGVLEWIDKDKIFDLPSWEGDKIFLQLLRNEERFFSLKLVYEDDKLVENKLDI